MSTLRWKQKNSLQRNQAKKQFVSYIMWSLNFLDEQLSQLRDYADRHDAHVILLDGPYGATTLAATAG